MVLLSCSLSAGTDSEYPRRHAPPPTALSLPPRGMPEPPHPPSPQRVRAAGLGSEAVRVVVMRPAAARARSSCQAPGGESGPATAAIGSQRRRSRRGGGGAAAARGLAVIDIRVRAAMPAAVGSAAGALEARNSRSCRNRFLNKKLWHRTQLFRPFQGWQGRGGVADPRHATRDPGQNRRFATRAAELSRPPGPARKARPGPDLCQDRDFNFLLLQYR